MFFLIPIPNFTIDKVFKAGKIMLIPHRYFEGEIDFCNSITEAQIKNVKDIMSLCAGDYLTNKFSKHVCALLEDDYTEDNFVKPIPSDEFDFLEKLCIYVDRSLDFFRINFCNLFSRESLPGFPGLISNYREGIIIDLDNHNARSLMGKVYTHYSLPGLGFYYDSELRVEDYEMYELFYGERKDEVYLMSRSALTRMNEAMYMNDINVSFIYLMSTLEMLASKDYINFTKTKSKILPFISNSKQEYHSLSARLMNLSKDIRTQIIHNCKSIYDLVNGKELNKIFNDLHCIILDYCRETVSLNIFDLNSLEEERKIRQRKLGVN